MHVCIQGADVELQSVSWACRAECAPVAAPVHGSVLGGMNQFGDEVVSGGIKHEGDTVSISCDSGVCIIVIIYLLLLFFSDRPCINIFY